MKPKFRNIFFRRVRSRSFYQATTTILGGFIFFAHAPVVWALPSGGSVVAGEAVINQGGNNTITIDQITSKAIIDWQKFSISAAEAMRFLQPDRASVILNRVTGTESSEIFGKMTANGNVFVINPNGILFGKSASIDVAGLMASTLNIKNEDFMAGNYSFTQDEAAKLAYVVNEGRITIGDNGFAYLVAPGVENKGVIVAKAGHVVMASGKQAYVDFSGNGLVKFKVSGKITEKIIGPDGKPMSSSVSNSGTIQAQGGQILLSGDTARDVVTSVVNNSGVMEASSFGDITGSVRMEARNKGGTVINRGKISVSGKNKGEKAGSVVLSGENVGQFGTIKADSKDGNAGSIDLLASKVVSLSSDSITTANANDRGNGGTILVIGGDTARVGTGALLQARGGAFGGDGGFIETSGHKNFEIGSSVDVSAAVGRSGTWLIDPADLEIVSGSTNTNITDGAGAFSSSADSAKLGVELILNALKTGNVVIRTGESGTQEGNITVNADIVYAGLADRSLTLKAHNNILINKNISALDSKLNLSLEAGSHLSFAGGVTVTTNGGNFTSSGINFSMADNSYIDAGSGAIVINNIGSVSLFNLTGGNISLTQAGGIDIKGIVSASNHVDLVANTGSITTNGTGKIVANSLNLVTKGTENASIGKVTYGTDAGGNVSVTMDGLKVDVRELSASTQSGISKDGHSTGNIIIENEGVLASAFDLTLGSITTNGDKGDTDIASVMIKSNRGIIGSGNGTHVDAFSASITANNDITLNTKLSVLKAETMKSGSITIDNTSNSLFILGAVARENGYSAQLSNGDIKAMDADGKYFEGTKNISITSTGEIGVQGDISATKKVSLESKNGSIVNAITGQGSFTITSNDLSLKAAGTVGSLGGLIKTLTGNRIDISAGTVEIVDPQDPSKKKDVGGVYLEEMNRLNIGTITAAGSEGNVFLTATAGNAYFAHSDSKITAKEGSVTINANAGNIQTHGSNTGDVIEAQSANLNAKSIGSDLISINTNIGALSVRATDAERGRINVKNSSALSSINVVTPGAAVDIASTGAVLKFGKDENLSIKNGEGTSLDFSNTIGGIKFDNINLGDKDLTFNAAKAITQTGGKLIAGNATIIAGENIGTSTKSIQTKVSSLNLKSGKNGIFVEQESSKDLSLNAIASGDGSDIKIVQTGTGNMAIKKVVSSKGGVILTSSGSILNDNEFLADVNISGNSLDLTASGVIGAKDKAIITSVSKAGGNADFTASASGEIVIQNSGNITLAASTSDRGDINFSNTGNVALGSVNVGSNNNVSLNAKGSLTDANGDSVNITAKRASLRANSIATSADKLETSVEGLDVTSTNGALYIKQLGNNDFYLTNATSAGTASIEAGGTIHLGVIDAIAQSVILKSESGDILDNRLSGSKKANVNAKSLDISARNLGTEAKRLNLNVGILSASSSGNLFAENLGSLHVTADSLTGKGVGQTVSLIASNITVFDNLGGTTTLDNNGSLELIAKNGNIIFLNTSDTVTVTGTGSIYFEALGLTLPAGETGLAGLIVAGNLKTDGGNITLKASSHISINLLDAGAGNVIVQSGGLIIDNNGAGVNIIAKNVSLSGKTLSDRQLDDDKKTSIADAIAKNLDLNTQTQLWGYAKNDAATYESLVAVYSQLYAQSLSNVSKTESSLSDAEKKAEALYQTFMALTVALDAANLAASILEIPAGAAQAIPLIGDAGAALVLGITNAILSGLQLGVNQAQRTADDADSKAGDLALELSGLKGDLYTNKQLMDTNEVLLDSKNLELGDLTERVDKATISLAASQIIKALTDQAAENNNVIGSKSQALGIQAENVDATAFGQSNVYIESPTTLGVGTITAHGKDTVVEVTAKDGISLKGTTTSSKNIVLYSENGAITAGVGAKLVSEDLIAVAKNGIGTNGAAINTTVKRIAASTENNGAHFVNENGNEALSIDEISVVTQNLTKTVTGVTAKGDIRIETSGDLVLNKAVRDTSKAGTVTLTATEGSITGTTDTPPAYHVEGGTLVATAANGIGSADVALRTDIAKLTANVTKAGLVNIVEKDAIELTSISTADGSIAVKSGGNIDAKALVSVKDAAGNTIDLNASNGNIVAGTISAGKTHGDITLSALEGQVNNDGNTSTRITGRNLVIAAKSGIGAVGTNANTSLDTSVAKLNATTETGVINISESDDLHVANVNTGDGDVTIASAGGDLNITKIAAKGIGNTVSLEASGKIADATATGDENGAVISATNLAATAGEGIGAEGNFIEVNVNNFEAKTTSGGIYINDLSGDLMIGGVTPNLGKPALNGVEAGAGNIVITTAGAMGVSETVTAGDGNIILTAQEGDITTTAAVAATTGDVSMDASGNITIGETVTAGNDVTMDAGQGIAINGAVTAAKDVLLTAQGGDIVTTAAVAATTGNVTMDASGSVNIGATVTANQNVLVTAQEGDITTTAAVAATTGNVEMTAGKAITIDGTVTAEENVLLAAQDGDITTTAAVAATTGNVEMTAGKAITIDGTVTAEENVLLTAQGGDIVTTAAVAATTGNVEMTASESVNIGATVTADKNVLLTAQGGDITTTAAVAATTGDVSMDASGNVTIGDTVTAGNDVTMDAGQGIAINGAVTAAKDVLLTAQGGDIVTTAAVAATTGNVEMTAGKGIEINETVTAEAGDISMLASGGDINLNQTVSAANGDVTLESTIGAILGGAANPPVYHVVAKELKATAAKGIGSDSVALRTNIETLVGSVTGKGDIVISQTGDLDADLTTEDGAITVDAEGTITATSIVSKTDSDDNDINLTSNAGDILVGNIAAGQGKEADVILKAQDGMVKANRPDGTPIIADDLIVVAKSGVDLDTSVNSADLTVTDDGDININETDDLVLTNAQTQGDGSISVVAGGKLEGIKVVAENGPINLTAKDDLIATHVSSTTNAQGNDINMTSATGDIIVDYVAAGTGTGGNVTLKAEEGEIRESTPKDGEVDIVGNKVNLHAKGDIGVSEDGGLNINSEILNAYSSEGNISLADIDDIVIHELHAKKGTVKVTSGGVISDDNNNDTKIIAKDLILESVAGIGVTGDASTRALDTEVETLTASVTGTGGINIEQKGNLEIKKVTSANGDIVLVGEGNIGVDLITANGKGNTVDLKAIGGAITDINDDSLNKMLNIAADKVKLDGSKGVGTRGNPLEISTSEISAKGGTGGLHITNLRENLIINDYTTTEGDLVLTTPGELVINNFVTNHGGGDIFINIADTGSDNDNIVLNAGISAVGGGSIYVNADDSIYQNANMTVENNNNVYVSAGDSIYMANGATTTVDTGNIVYKAGNEIELGKLVVSKTPYGGTVTVDAPTIRNNNAIGDAAIQAGYIFVNTNNIETKELILNLIGGKDNSYGIWLNNRLVGGLVSRDATFINSPHWESELQGFDSNRFQMNSKYKTLPMTPVNYKKKGFIYDEKTGALVYKP